MSETLISSQGDVWLDSVRTRVTRNVYAGTRGNLATVLARLATEQRAGCTIDLVGHATGIDPHREGPRTTCSFLQLDDWIIDDSEDTVGAFRELLPSFERLRPAALRLLGCSTAMTRRGARALSRIAEVLAPAQVAVFGTNRAMYSDDFDADGFRHEPSALVAAATALADVTEGAQATQPLPIAVDPQRLDPEQLLIERCELRAPVPAWRRAVVDMPTTDGIWRLVRPEPSLRMPEINAAPLVELLLPTSTTRKYAHRMQVLLNWELVRVFWPSSTGPNAVPRVYQVSDPAALHALVDAVVRVRA